jgi:hypothetical protein
MALEKVSKSVEIIFNYVFDNEATNPADVVSAEPVVGLDEISEREMALLGNAVSAKLVEGLAKNGL